MMELTEYEMVRQPHPAKEEGVVSLTMNALNEQLKCPICLCILSKTMTTMDCMHRFCSECINKSLRFGKKECPSCRTPCVSRRSLRPDVAIDKMIALLYPDLTVLEKQQEELMKQIQSHHNARALAESIEDGLKDQAKMRSSRAVRSGTPESVPESSESKNEGISDLEDDDNDPDESYHGKRRKRAKAGRPPKVAEAGGDLKEAIEFILSRHPDEEKLPILTRKYAKTPPDCTMAHLSKYLHTAFEEESFPSAGQKFELYICQGSKWMKQSDATTLRTIMFTCDRTKSLTLYYRHVDAAS